MKQRLQIPSSIIPHEHGAVASVTCRGRGDSSFCSAGGSSEIKIPVPNAFEVVDDFVGG